MVAATHSGQRGEEWSAPYPGSLAVPRFLLTEQQKVDTEGIGVLGYLPSLGPCLVKNPRSLMCLTTPPFQDVQKRIADSDSLEVPDQLPHPAAITSPPDSDAISPS